MAQLPLKIRVDIRDLWDAPDSAVNKSVETLYQTLGHKITPDVEWQAIWAEVGERFPEKDRFVPAVVMVVTAWNERLLARLENDIYAKWTEELLEALSEARAQLLKLHIQPAASVGSGGSRPSSEWNPKLSSFMVYIPNAAPISLGAITSGFESDFDKFFGGTTAKDVHVGQDHGSELRSGYLSATADRLPTLDMLARPDELLRTTTPYMMIVDVSKNGIIVIQCSHQASLELLAAYTQKWGKKNAYANNTQWPNVLKTQLHDSDFCFGVMDCLTIEHIDICRSVNPTIVLAFVEGILGYQMVHTNGSHWVYKLDKRFQ